MKIFLDKNRFPSSVGRHFLVVILITAAFLLSFSSPVKVGKIGLKLYVSTAGNDNWSGRLINPDKKRSDGPLATLEGARNEIRRLRAAGKLPNGQVIVEIQEGTYSIQEPFVLDNEDSGKDSLSPVIYTGHKGAEVRLTGGRVITKWEKISDEKVLSRLKENVRDKVFQTNLAEQKISGYGSPAGPGMELFFNDKPMLISRYPNKGFMIISGVANDGSKDGKKVILGYEDRHINLWTNEKDVWVHGYWYYDWSEQRHKVTDIDTINRHLEIAPPYHKYGYRAGQWFYGFNLLSEIDTAGEYYTDRERGVIYFYPPSDIGGGRTVVSMNSNIINMNDVSNVLIKGVIIEDCRETAVQMKNCKNTALLACTIRNTGDWAVTIDGGEHNVVKDCDIYEAGAGGIRIKAGNVAELIPAGCVAENNYIHHIARLKWVYSPGISLDGVGNKAVNNLIEHIPHMAIYFNGNDHLIEYNEINDVCFNSNDAGAVYAGRSWTMRGNIVRYNYLHDISGFENKGCIGVYLDDLFCGTKVYGNIFNRVTRAILVGGVRDNSVTNNIFVDCAPSIDVDARGLGWYAVNLPVLINEAKTKGTLSGINYSKPPYSVRYPELINIINDNPEMPRGNIVSRNICYRGNWDKPEGFWKAAIEDKARPFLKMEDNIVSENSSTESDIHSGYLVTDPGFINPANPEKGKFSLKSDSPALKHGFIQIPFDKIGLYKDENRTFIKPE